MYTNNMGPAYNHIINLCAVIIFYSTYVFSMFVVKCRVRRIIKKEVSNDYNKDQVTQLLRLSTTFDLIGRVNGILITPFKYYVIAFGGRV